MTAPRKRREIRHYFCAKHGLIVKQRAIIGLLKTIPCCQFCGRPVIYWQGKERKNQP